MTREEINKYVEMGDIENGEEIEEIIEQEPCKVKAKKMDEYLPEIISIIVTILICAALFLGACTIDNKHSEKLWNNGRCDVCGGTWEYEQAVGHSFETSYIYVCHGCGKRIEISEMR